MTHSPRPLRRRLAAVTALTTLAGLTATSFGTAGSAYAAAPPPRAPFLPTAATPAPPTLTPADGSFLEGTVTVTSEAVAAGDDVTALTVDGNQIAAAETLGSSQLSFDVGDNSIETRFGNYILVNGDHRIDLTDAVNERVTLTVPNTELVTGDNTVEIFTGAIDSSCGLNNDDFAVSEVRLELLGETADGEDNEFTYSMGDGSCGTNTSLLTHATLHFFVQGTPGETTGLQAELDTRTLSNGRHRIAATTAAGKTTSHVVRVNNAPAGAPRISPTDGTLVAGKQTITAANAVGSGGAAIDNLLIDGAVPPAATTLAGGTAAFRFTVGTNSIEARYFNYLEVNGHHVDIGGDWVSQAVSIPIPRHYLVNGENTVRIVTGDINSGSGATLCANRDDFSLSALSMTVEGGTVTPVGNASTYAMGDGTCGSSTTALPEATLTFDVSGAPTSRTLATLGSGDANLSMYIGGNGTEARYNNYVLVNGNQLFLGDYVGTTASLTIPNEWLIPGVNVVEIVGGYFTTSCGANMDDYPVSEVSLTPASGTATLTHKSTSVAGAAVAIQIGDGSCGSSFTGTDRVGLTFAVDAPAQGLRSDVETAMLPDGEHTVSATSAGVTATRTLVTDNTAPLLASSVPATGQRITSAVAFDLQLNDLAGVAGTPTTTLDGEPIALGDPVGPGLVAGPHVIAVTATDALGNTATREISFTSAGIPDVPTALVPASGTTGLGRTVDLEAQVAVAGGGDVTATFTEAAVVVPDTAFQGLSTKVPTTLQVAGEEEVDASSLTPLGDATLASKAGRDVTFQRYDLDVSGGQDGADPVLRWTGTVDPERIVALRAWNSDTRAWDVLSSARGVLEGDTVLTVRAPARYVDRGTVHVMVTGEDPFADDIDPGSQDGFADPSDYDFSLVHFTDTQYLAEGAVEQETEAERAIWKAAYGATTEWIAQHKTSSKIAYVAHTGDITENNIDAPTTPEMQAQVTGEFEVTSELQATLDKAGVVNQVIAGNHDNQRGREEGPDAIYNDYYGPERYQAADDQWGTTASYGGPWKEGDNQNNYVLFSAGGLEFVAVGLSYGVTREEADWATSIFQRYPERNGIVLSHDYLKPSPNRDGRGSGFSVPDGSLLYKLVVEANPNVFLVLAGHEHGVGTNIKTGVGATVTHDVVELLADYQAYTVTADELGLTEIGGYAPTDRLRFGASFLRMLQFDVDRGEMIVDTYSPFLDDFGAVEYDPDLRYDEGADNMVLPVDLTSRKTQFTTSDIAAFVPVSTVGTDTVASGSTATATWSGLAPRTTYGWIATSTSPGGGRAVAEPGVFRTGPAAPSVVSAADTSVAHGAVASVPVTVTPAGSSDVATGEVTLSEAGTVLATAPVTAGAATVSVPAGLAPGAHTLVASYAGSGWVGDGTDELVLTVGKGTSGVTATSPSVTVGEVPVVTATVTGVAGAEPTGSVRVLEGTTVLGTARLVDGVARVELPTNLSVGEHPLTVDYAGDDQLSSSTAATTLTVRAKAKLASTTTVRANPATVKRNRFVTLTVTVRAPEGTPTGRVTVMRDGRQRGAAALSAGKATIRVKATDLAGRRTFNVRYLGSGTVLPSIAKVTVRVLKP